MCQISLKLLRPLAILAIAIFPLSEAQIWSFEAVDIADRGECFVGTAYLANAMDCSNEGELIPDPLAGNNLPAAAEPGILPGITKLAISLCDSTANGRFNLAQLFPKTPAAPFPTALPGVGTQLPTTADTRNRQCSEPNQMIFANKCLRSCKRCCILPKFTSCKDVVTTPPCDGSRCNTDANYALQLCPSTCGRCIEALQANLDTELCIDTATDCLSRKLTNIPTGQCPTGIEKTCALTCNNPNDNKLCKDFTADMKAALATTTTAVVPVPPGPVPVPIVPGGGVDLATNCAQNKDLCTNPVYKDYMQKNCLVTCKSAGGGTGTSSSCQDKPHTNCVIWKRNGFCNNTFYSEDFRKENCGFTCKLC